MFNVDGDILKDLLKTSVGITIELNNIVGSLQEDPTQNDLYEKFGQSIDGIYGVVSTLGMKNFAEYTRSLKHIGYACSQYDEQKGRARTISLLESAVENLNLFNILLTNPKDTNNATKLKQMVDREKAKAEKLIETVYKHIDRISTDK